MVQINWGRIGDVFKPPLRAGIAVMLFMACFVSYMMRVNLSINIIAMIDRTPGNATDPPSNEHGPQYKWDKNQEGFLLTSYFWGYMLTSLFGGVMAETLGAKQVITYTLLASAVFTALCPIAAASHYALFFVCRLLIGFLAGALYPCCHTLISKWAPPSEKGKFVASLMGGTFGTVVTWPLCGLLIEQLGWPWGFYMVSIITCAVVIIWMLIVANKPHEHKWISEKEKVHIEESLAAGLSQPKRWPPFLAVSTSLPFIALLLLHFGNMWGLYFLITAAPKFMTEVLGFNISSAGFLSSLPYLARMLSAFMFGAIGDFIRGRNYLTVTKIRKIFCIFSHILPGCFLILLGLIEMNHIVAVTVVTLSLGFNGAATLTNLQNSQDLSPNYAGSLYGIINCLGQVPGIVSPMIVAYFTSQQSTMAEWRWVFFIGASVYITSAIFFIIFGSGKIQKWNYSKEEQDKMDQNQVENQKTKL